MQHTRRMKKCNTSKAGGGGAFAAAVLAAMLLLLSGCVLEQRAAECAACINGSSVEVYFCPEDSCDVRILGEIDAARESVHAAVYSLTLDSVGDALIRAKERGVDVKVVIDRQQASVRGSEFQRLRDANVLVLLDGNPDYMHNKFAVFDGARVVTGSYNWTMHATEGNDENLILLESAEIAAKYRAEFEEIWSEARGAEQQ